MSNGMHCSRCKASSLTEFGEVDHAAAATLRLAEVSTNFGVVVVMCIGCRHAWATWINKNQMMRTYAETGFTLEHYRTAHRRTGAEPLEKGLALIRTLNDLDEKLFDAGLAWIKAGLTKQERKQRQENETGYNQTDETDDR